MLKLSFELKTKSVEDEVDACRYVNNYLISEYRSNFLSEYLVMSRCQ